MLTQGLVLRFFLFLQEHAKVPSCPGTVPFEKPPAAHPSFFPSSFQDVPKSP